MSRPRDRASAAGLLPRMEARPWADGKRVTYRYHPVGGKPINLGTDREAALRRVLDMNGETPHHGALRWVWEQFQNAKRWKKLAEGKLPDIHADPRITARVYDATKEVGRKSL